MGVGEVFLGAFITVLFERLASRHLLNFAFPEAINEQLGDWSILLSKIQAVLRDSEEKQSTNEAVKMWLRDLQDLADDIDDMLDDMATEDARCKLLAEDEVGSSMGMVQEFFSSVTNSVETVKSKYNMGSKIDDISKRLGRISKQKILLDLKEDAGGIKSTKNESRRRPPSTSLKPHVYGREEDRKHIIELLLKSDEDEFIPTVVSIVGMGGIGKTTLAQDAYNDDKVESCFDLKAWVCVSDHFDVVALTRTILLSLTPEARNLNDFNDLQVQLKNKLAGKKFLLVLDDIWSEDYGAWDHLRQPFMSGSTGSKILITTRSVEVASVMRARSPYYLKVLGIDDGLSLLAQHAFDRRNFDENPQLKEIGKQIVEKCKGLPLAVKTLGGLLRRRQPCQSEWEDILSSNIWDLPEEESGILPALQLSYHHLPPHLKQCFAYCSIFPKDYEFDKDKLVLLWLAVGLLQQSKGPKRKRIEDVGGKHFDDLLSMSFFQQSSGNESRFVMHDLMNDLAQHVAGEICFRLEEKSAGNEHFETSNRARHFSYIRQRYEVFKKFEGVDKLHRLRTFLPLWTVELNGVSAGSFHLSNKILVDLVLPVLQRLRVLSLCGYSISELPDSIGDLKLLRYLDLSYTNIKWLPESVSTLYNLQTLSLHGCTSICKLPKNIGNLINLRHLDNTNTPQLLEMPSGIGKLTSLQTLSKIVVGKKGELQLKHLGNLVSLRGTVSIVELKNVVDTRDVMGVNLFERQDLEELELKWAVHRVAGPRLIRDARLRGIRDARLRGIRDARPERDVHVLHMLKPHRNLKRLKIEFFCGLRFPSWIGDPSFCKVVEISLINCTKCTSLPPLGQLPKLKDLCISGMTKIKKVGDEFYKDVPNWRYQYFSSLERLSFLDMGGWEEWSHVSDGEVGGQFPRLHELSMVRCPNLVTVPLLSLPSLQVLELKECCGTVLKSFADLTSLINVEINGVTELTCLRAEFMQFSTALEVLKVYNCTDLVSLWQNGVTAPEHLVRMKALHVKMCPQLVSLGEEEQGLPCNLEVLELSKCSNLEKLPNSLTSLKQLTITKCPKLVSFQETGGPPPMLRRVKIESCDTLESLPKEGIAGLEDLSIIKCPSLRSMGKLSTTLKRLQIEGCMGLESLPRIEGLEELCIRDCPSLRSCPTLPTTFKKLGIWNCVGLESLSPIEGISCLEEMQIHECPCLRSLPTLPTALKKLDIRHLDQLVMLQDKNNDKESSSLEDLTINYWPHFKSLVGYFHYFAILVKLEIQNCDELECFPEGGLPTPNLVRLSISSCNKLRSLTDGIQRLASLQSLDVYNCTNLESFPEADFPPNLKSLHISNCEKLKPLSEWGLHRLTSLWHFCITGGYPEVVSFSDNDDDQCLLPPTLTSLIITRLPNLESLSNGLQNLTSLQFLTIVNCPKLRSLPKVDLFPMLSKLQIFGCPILKRRCLREEEDYWPKIVI